MFFNSTFIVGVMYMNRIRQTDVGFQVLQTPRNMNKITPDSAFLMGSFDDADIRNFSVVTFQTLQDAQVEALNYPDINWERIVRNHQFIYQRLHDLIRTIVQDAGVNVDIDGQLMNPVELKNLMFNRAINGHAKSRSAPNNIISFRVSNPWSANLVRVIELLLSYKGHGYRDDLRIREQEAFDKKIFILTGATEAGTMYEIKLIPTLLKFWADWDINRVQPDGGIYAKILQEQEVIDKGPVLR